jgi:ABC-type uncharacterized transport system involved in gliding motility auxiliary subunit
VKLRSTILGIATLLALCGAFALQFLYVNEYVSLAAWGITLLLAATWVALDRVRVAQFLTRKSTRYGANVALVLFLVLGILVFVNMLAKQHSWRKDFTRTGANTLGEQSQKIVGGLTQDVTAYYFQSLAEKDRGEDVLKRYSYLNKHFKFEFVDVDRYPTRAAAMGVKRKNAVILTLGNSQKKVSVTEPSEEQLTNGLIKLLRSAEVSVYFLAGHDEHPLAGESEALGYSQLKAELEKAGYTVKELNLVGSGKIPSDAAVLVVGGPKKAFYPKELDVIGAWMKDGGHTVLAFELDLAESGLAKGSRQLADVLKPFGVNVMNQMLVDPLSQAAKVDVSSILGFADSTTHPISKDFPRSKIAANFLFPLTTYLTVTPAPALTVSPLVHTTEQAWAESDWASLKQGSASYDERTDHRGRMELAFAVEGQKPEGQSQPSARGVKFVVFANANFATNTMLDKAGNRDLFLNAVAWLADEDRFISIRPKEDPDALKQFNSNAISMVLLVTIFLIPLLLLAVGIYVWLRRSKL